MKILFMGTSTFAIPALKEIANHVHLVVTSPDRKSGRGMKLTPSPVKLIAHELGIDTLTPEKASSSSFVDIIKKESFDFAIVAAYGQILKPTLLNSTRNGFFNLHGSILPFYRGAAPIQRSIMNNDIKTGVTLMKMDEGMDTGDIIDIIETDIHQDDHCGYLYEKLAGLAGELASKWIDQLYHNTFPTQKQNHDIATYASKITKEDRFLQFKHTALHCYNQFRALSPKPGACIQTSLGDLSLIEIKPVKNVPSRTPGSILIDDHKLILFCKEHAVELIQVKMPGKKIITGIDFAKGYRINQSIFI